MGNMFTKTSKDTKADVQDEAAIQEQGRLAVVTASTRVGWQPQILAVAMSAVVPQVSPQLLMAMMRHIAARHSLVEQRLLGVSGRSDLNTLLALQRGVGSEIQPMTLPLVIKLPSGNMVNVFVDFSQPMGFAAFITLMAAGASIISNAPADHSASVRLLPGHANPEQNSAAVSGTTHFALQ